MNVPLPNPGPRLFRAYSAYLRERYGKRAYRISVDAGFSCPHRGQSRDGPGCTFCDGQGARAPYLGSEMDMRVQVRRGIEFMTQRYGAEVFLLYFQPFSNTNAPAARLKEIYDFALGLAPFRELIVSTRPDCLDAEKAAVLASYLDRGLDVWVELGLQSACERTLRHTRRGHTVEDFFSAYRLLSGSGVKIATHLIFGLPGEGRKEVYDSVERVAALRPDGLKIHNLHIPVETAMFAEYLQGELTAPGAARHLGYTIAALERLPPETVVMRLTCDTPGGRLAAPRRFWDKSRFYRAVNEEMRRRGTWQGKQFRSAGPPGVAGSRS